MHGKGYRVSGLAFDYDSANDILYAYKDRTSAFTTVELGDFHLELAKDRSIVGVEVTDASDVLGEYGISRSDLERIERVALRVGRQKNLLLVFLEIKVQQVEEEKLAAITLKDVSAALVSS